jgi:trk system potassium uptake protein TrkA
MRIVFSGAGPVTIITARTLIEQGHEVVIIEVDKERIDAVADELDGSFLHGDAASPDLLSQVDPKHCDFLFCLTDSDQSNILTSLLGRSMGFRRVVTSIEDPDLDPLCRELGLDDTIIPALTMSRRLADMARGLDNVELSTMLREDARFFTFTAGKDEAVRAESLELPGDSRVIFFYRNDEVCFVDADTSFRQGDEIIVLTRSEHLAELNEQWRSNRAYREQ